MEKRWTIPSVDTFAVKSLQDQLKIKESLCRLFVQRGLNTFEKAKEFFNPKIEQLHDSFLMKDMDKATNRILTAISNKEKILVFGDYDVDGTTSVAILYHFLCKIYNKNLLDYYIPDRYREGYGISKEGIEFAKENNFTLIISLDCGIKSVELVAFARELNIDFIICDHHLPGEILPMAVAILNPKQKDCIYPYKELCGCGVTFKMVTALCQLLKIENEIYLSYIDLLAIAIGADIVPMTGENRSMAFLGLKKLNRSPSAGIKALMEVSKQETNYNISAVVFLIAPRVNAAGRMGDARDAVKLFIEEDESRAAELAKHLHVQNQLRKEQDESVTMQALEMINSDEKLINKKTSVLFKEGWHKGVLGIVASRLIETYHRPTIVLTIGEDWISGSARSVPGFNLYDAIHSCSEHLEKFGGHTAAAGLTLLPEKMLAFSEKFEQVVSSTIDPQLLIPEIRIDVEIEFDEIDQKFFNTISRMEPFGPENNRPVFVTRNVKCDEPPVVLKEKHLRFYFPCKNKTIIAGIGFQLANKLHLFQDGEPVDLAYTIDENVWNDQKTLQLKVIDIKQSSATIA